VIVNVHEAKTQLSRLLERVASGEEVIIGRAGRPVARLVPYVEPLRPRAPGRWRGRVRVAEDFDVTPEAVVAAFEGQ
jgi:prevent-host-death family protein